MGGRGSPGGGRGRGTVGLGRLFLYLLLPSSPRFALTLPLSSFPLFFFTFPAASGYRFPSFYSYYLGFSSRFLYFRVRVLLARCGERFGLCCLFFFPFLMTRLLCCLDSGEGRALRDARFLPHVPLSAGTHVTLDPHVRDSVCVGVNGMVCGENGA